MSVGDTRADLKERLGKPEREGAVWRYKVRVSDSLGVVKVLFDGKRAMNVFTDDPHFRYRGVRVGTGRDEAVRVLRGAGFRLGRCGPGRALHTPNKRTPFGLYGGEVANHLRGPRFGQLRPLAAPDQHAPAVHPPRRGSTRAEPRRPRRSQQRGGEEVRRRPVNPGLLAGGPQQRPVAAGGRVVVA